MESETNLSNEWVPINSLRKYDNERVLKVFLIGSGAVKEFKNDKNEGLRWILTFVDEEGTKIQGIVFNNLIETFQKIFKQSKTYYITNGIINSVNPKYSSVHKEFEIFFKEHTIVKECKDQFSTVMFSNNFISFEEASYLPEGTIFDTVGILVKAKPTIRQGKIIRKEIIIMNERYDRKKVTLWSEVAEHEGDMLQKVVVENPVVALCDVKSTSYLGESGMATTFVTTVVINPVFEKALALKNWHDNVKAQNKDITLMPSKLIKEARSVKLTNIIHDSFGDINIAYCKVNGKINKILDAHAPWYLSCKKCYKKVNVVNDIGKCPRCGILETEDYEERYLLKLEVVDVLSDEEKAKNVVQEYSYVSLFEAAKCLIGCDVKIYRQSISKENEDSKFYRKLISNTDKEFTFLVKIDAKNASDRAARRLVAEELHEAGIVDAIEIEDEETKPEITLKKTKKIGENNSLSNKKIKIEKN